MFTFPKMILSSLHEDESCEAKGQKVTVASQVQVSRATVCQITSSGSQSARYAIKKKLSLKDAAEGKV